MVLITGVTGTWLARQLEHLPRIWGFIPSHDMFTNFQGQRVEVPGGGYRSLGELPGWKRIGSDLQIGPK